MVVCGMSSKPVQSIAISEFKATCLTVLERGRRTSTSVLVTRRGAPVAEINLPSPATVGTDWMGCLRTTVTSVGEIVSPVASDEREVLSSCPSWTANRCATD